LNKIIIIMDISTQFMAVMNISFKLIIYTNVACHIEVFKL